MINSDKSLKLVGDIVVSLVMKTVLHIGCFFLLFFMSIGEN